MHFFQPTKELKKFFLSPFLLGKKSICSNSAFALILNLILNCGFPGGSDGKEPACNAEDPGLIPGWGRSPGEGNGYLFQYSLLENSMDRGAWWVMVYGEGDDRG